MANRQWRDTRGQALDTAYEVEELMKENLAASLGLALGIAFSLATSSLAVRSR
jgi:hypothetical protein